MTIRPPLPTFTIAISTGGTATGFSALQTGVTRYVADGLAADATRLSAAVPITAPKPATLWFHATHVVPNLTLTEEASPVQIAFTDLLQAEGDDPIAAANSAYYETLAEYVVHQLIEGGIASQVPLIKAEPVDGAADGFFESRALALRPGTDAAESSRAAIGPHTDDDWARINAAVDRFKTDKNIIASLDTMTRGALRFHERGALAQAQELFVYCIKRTKEISEALPRARAMADLAKLLVVVKMEKHVPGLVQEMAQAAKSLHEQEFFDASGEIRQDCLEIIRSMKTAKYRAETIEALLAHLTEINLEQEMPAILDQMGKTARMFYEQEYSARGSEVATRCFALAKELKAEACRYQALCDLVRNLDLLDYNKRPKTAAHGYNSEPLKAVVEYLSERSRIIEDHGRGSWSRTGPYVRTPKEAASLKALTELAAHLESEKLSSEIVDPITTLLFDKLFVDYPQFFQYLTARLEAQPDQKPLLRSLARRALSRLHGAKDDTLRTQHAAAAAQIQATFGFQS